MLYDLNNPLQAQNFKKRVNLLYQRKGIVDLTERRPQRSRSQNSYLHAALGYFGLQFGYKTQQVKDWYFKEICNPDIFIREELDQFSGKTRRYLRSSADLDSAEMTLAIERFRNWASDSAGVYIPSPEEHLLVEQMEAETQRAAAFL